MFHSTRIKLTVWYLFIIMLISTFFSLVIYTQINSELEHIEYSQRLRQERIERMFGKLPPYIGDPASQIKVIQDSRERLILTLIIINAVILTISGTAGYFLAGRTLKPIKTMLDEQHRFIADASHELRTPLTSLRSEIEVGLRSKKMSVKDARLLLKSNLEEVISLQQLSDELLELARYDSSTKERKCKTVSIRSTIEKSINTIQPLAEMKQIKISYDSSDGSITGEEQRITQLFVILLDNAVKYSMADSTITIATKKTHKRIAITVKDQGIGIETSDIPHIFDRFYRANKSRAKHTSHGYGLGLSIAQKIVHAHNGSITVKSTLNKGSLFTVSFPRLYS